MSTIIRNDEACKLLCPYSFTGQDGDYCQTGKCMAWQCHGENSDGEYVGCCGLISPTINAYVKQG